MYRDVLSNHMLCADLENFPGESFSLMIRVQVYILYSCLVRFYIKLNIFFLNTCIHLHVHEMCYNEIKHLR